MKSLKSSVEKQGKIVDKIIQFSGGNKKTFEGVLSETIRQGEFTKFEMLDGRLIMVNTKNVDFVEVFTREK